VRIACGGSRRITAVGVDAAGQPVDEEIRWAWSLTGPVGSLDEQTGAPHRILLVAAAEPAEGTIRALAAGRELWGEAPVEIVEEIGSERGNEGIPQPEPVSDPGASWRSRMQDERWQVNSAHRDYRAVIDRPAPKLRYLAMLFAKEVVLRSTQDLRFDKPLEQLVEVAAYADRKLSERKGRRPSSPRGDES